MPKFLLIQRYAVQYIIATSTVKGKIKNFNFKHLLDCFIVFSHVKKALRLSFIFVYISMVMSPFQLEGYTIYGSLRGLEVVKRL